MSYEYHRDRRPPEGVVYSPSRRGPSRLQYANRLIARASAYWSGHLAERFRAGGVWSSSLDRGSALQRHNPSLIDSCWRTIRSSFLDLWPRDLPRAIRASARQASIFIPLGLCSGWETVLLAAGSKWEELLPTVEVIIYALMRCRWFPYRHPNVIMIDTLVANISSEISGFSYSAASCLVRFPIVFIELAGYPPTGSPRRVIEYDDALI